jgi:threonine aldolase
MRQVGYLAAAGIYALDHNIDRLKTDNDRAKYLGSLLATLPFVESLIPVESNIVIFKLRRKDFAGEFLAKLKEHDIHALPFDPQTIRFVTHLDFTDTMMLKVESVLKTLNF